MYRISDFANVDSLLLTQITAAQSMPFAVNLSVGSGAKYATNVPGLVVLALIGETETGTNGVIEIFEYDDISGDVMTLSDRALDNTSALDWPVGSKVQIRLVPEHLEQVYRVLDDPKVKNRVFAGPGSGADAVPTFRSLVADDIPNIQNLNGTLTIGKGGSGLSSVTAGSVLIGDGTNPMVEVAGSSSGDVLTWDGSAWGASSAPTGTPHSILSSTHSDSTAAAVTRGALITGQGATPKWTKLAVGAANRSLISDGTDLAWGQVSLTAGVTGTLPVTSGGLGFATATTGDIIYASGSNTLAKLGIGASGQVLAVSSGVPAWVNLSSLSLGSHTHSGGDITSGVVGQAYGGTGMTSYTAGAIIYANGSGNLTTLPIGTNGQVLTISGGVPTWTAAGAGTGTVTSVQIGTSTTGLTATGGPITISGSIVLGGVLAVAHGGTNQSSYTAGDILYATAGTTLAKLGIGTAGQVLTVSGGVPAWTSAGAGTVTSVSGSGGTTGLTLTGGAITSSGTLTLGGVLVEANGGTNQSTYATGDMLYATGVNTLGKLAAGSDTQVLTLAGGVPTWAAPSGVSAHALLSATHTDTTAAAVARGSLVVGVGASPKWEKLVLGAANRVLRSDGTDALWAQVNLTSDVTGTLPVGNGGTGITSGAVGDIFYFSGVSTVSKLTIGSSGQFLKVAAGIPSWGAGSTLNYFSEPATSPTDALTASATDSTAVGNGAVAVGTRSVAIGKGRAGGTDSVVIMIGNNTTSYGARGTDPVQTFVQGDDNQANNSASNNAHYSLVMGGQLNTVTGFAGTSLGGQLNTVSGSLCGNFSSYGSANAGTKSVILGGESHSITSASLNSGALAGYTNSISGDYAASLGGVVLNLTGYAQVGIGQFNTIMPAAASSTFTAADPLLIIGNGTANGTSTRSNSFYVTGNSIVNAGGKETGGANGNTGIFQMGFTGETTRAKLTPSTHAADRTYTIQDHGANATVLMANTPVSNYVLAYDGSKPVWRAPASLTGGVMVYTGTGATCSSTAAETDILNFTIGASEWADKEYIEIRALSEMLQNTGGPLSLTLKVYLNADSVTILSASIPASATTAQRYDKVYLVREGPHAYLRASMDDSADNVAGSALSNPNAATDEAVDYQFVSPVFTSSMTLKITAQWAGASGSAIKKYYGGKATKM